MKKISIAVNIALIAIIVFMAFGASQKAIPNVHNQFKACYSCDKDAFYGVKVGEFIRDVARYRKTHWDKINSDDHMLIKNKGMKDARTCWYAIDTLKKFICLIEKYSEALGLKSDKLGIRFYYATYPAKGVWKPEYKSHHTLFMVPTFRDDKTYDNIDFDPRYNMREKKFQQPLAQIGKENLSVQLFVLDGGTSNGIAPAAPAAPAAAAAAANVVARNQGQLCPPTCPRSGPGSNMLQYIDSLYPSGLAW